MWINIVSQQPAIPRILNNRHIKCRPRTSARFDCRTGKRGNKIIIIILRSDPISVRVRIKTIERKTIVLGGVGTFTPSSICKQPIMVCIQVEGSE